MKKLVFLHIEKTAGNTLHQILFNNRRGYIAVKWNQGNSLTPESIIKIQKKFPFKITGIGGHRIDCTKRNSYFGKDQFTFTVLRNPVDRYISFYNHMIIKHKHTYPFDEFLDDIRHHNYQTKCIARRDDLELAKEILKTNFDFVGIKEHMSTTLKHLNASLSIDIEQRSLNISNQRVISLEDLTESQLARTKELNKLDLELYNYALNLFKTQELATARPVRVPTWRRLLAVVQKKAYSAWVNQVVLRDY